MEEGDSDGLGRFWSRLLLLGLTFGVIGPLGIPMIWLSPHFSVRERVVFTVLSFFEVAILFFVLVRVYLDFLLSIGADGIT